VPVAVNRQVSERAWNPPTRFAGSGGVEIAGGAFSLLDLGKDAQAALLVVLAELGEGDAACRAVQQPDAEMRLGRAHVLAHQAGEIWK
jgi:hypothetical protein